MPHQKVGRNDERNQNYRNLTIMQKRKIKQQQKAQKIYKPLHDMKSAEKAVQSPMKVKQVYALTESNLKLVYFFSKLNICS